MLRAAVMSRTDKDGAMEDRVLTLEEVSKVTGLAVRTLQSYIKKGELRAFKPGGANRIGWRVTWAEVQRLVRSRVPEEFQPVAEADAERKLKELPECQLTR